MKHKKSEIIEALENKLRPIIEDFVKFEVRYCYNKRMDKIFVSYSSLLMAKDNCNLCSRLFDLENEMGEYFEEDKPLFCYEEQLFKLSVNAKIINYDSIQKNKEIS